MEKIQEAVKYIQSIYEEKPVVGIVLGSGLGGFTDEIKIEKKIFYSDIPNFPVSTVKGHSGKLIFGELSGKKVAAIAGRFQYYEGYDTAKYHMINLLGADAVGMSTVQETITAVQMAIPVFAISVITDLGICDEENKITHEEVLAAAKEAEPKLAYIFKELVAQL